MELSFMFLAHSLLKFMQRKEVIAVNKFSVNNFAEKEGNLITIVEMEGIPPELILNWDQISVKWSTDGWSM